MHFVNPFIDLHQENPSLAQEHAKPLKVKKSTSDSKKIKKSSLIKKLSIFQGFSEGDAKDIMKFTDLLFSGQTQNPELERTGAVLLKVMGREVQR